MIDRIEKCADFRGIIYCTPQISLGEIDDVLPEIKKGLEEKMEAMVRRDLYTKYKTAPTEEEREKARQEYLEKVECTGASDGKFFPSVCRTGACHAPV